MFKEELKLVPHLPGSYQMYNKDNVIIYVGKANSVPCCFFWSQRSLWFNS